ncbi:MAG: aldo/keto reductase [Planctomycetota bacterium]|jgi:predicted aldo/keto reductase-like oxidoreductase
MENDKVSRREFIRNTSLVAAGAVAGAFTGPGCGSTFRNTAVESTDTSKILNYNPGMSYRRLGKTGLIISEISLGGHWTNRDGVRYWLDFANDEVPDDVARNRTDVVSRCIDHGINYLDITTSAECLSYGAALKGRRHKMYIAADDCELCPRHEEHRNVNAQSANIDSCLRRLGTDYLDIWRPQFNQAGGHADSDIETCVEAFEKAHAQGKVRFLGMSSHNRQFVQHVIEKFPQYSVATFPYTAKSKVRPPDIRSVDAKKVVELGAGDGAYSGDTRKSIFAAVQKHDIGVITIKPFGGGSLFRTKIKFGENVESTEQDYERARLTLAYILCNRAISALVVGMTTIAETDNNIRASSERLALLDQNGIWKLCEATDRMWADLPSCYQFLHDWEWV